MDLLGGDGGSWCCAGEGLGDLERMRSKRFWTICKWIRRWSLELALSSLGVDIRRSCWTLGTRSAECPGQNCSEEREEKVCGFNKCKTA